MAQAAAQQQQGAEGPSEDEKEFKAAMEKAATNVE
jgi:hypothetical protein